MRVSFEDSALMLGLEQVGVLEVARGGDGRGVTTAVGVDESEFLAARRREPTPWVSAICDVARRLVIDVIEGRQAPDRMLGSSANPRRGARA